MRFPVWMQALLVVLLAVVLALVVTSVVDDWTDWVVLGGIVVAVVGMMIAVNTAATRPASALHEDSDSRW